MIFVPDRDAGLRAQTQKDLSAPSNTRPFTQACVCLNGSIIRDDDHDE